VDFSHVRGFSFSCQQKMGGFSKSPDVYPDVLHTYMSLCGLSLGGEGDILPIDPAFGFNKRVAETFK